MFKSWLTCVVMAAACLIVLGPAVRADAAKRHKKSAAKGIPNKSFDKLDADHNGYLSMTEIFGKQPKKGSAARKAFHRADKDHNDWLDRQEFKVLKRIGIHGGNKRAGNKGGKKRGHGKR